MVYTRGEQIFYFGPAAAAARNLYGNTFPVAEDEVCAAFFFSRAMGRARRGKMRISRMIEVFRLYIYLTDLLLQRYFDTRKFKTILYEDSC